MKTSNSIRRSVYVILSCLFLITSCRKDVDQTTSNSDGDQSLSGKTGNGHLHQTKTYSSEVAQKWHDLQLRILRLPAGPNPYSLHGNRYFAYFGIALYESVVPGMPEYQSLYGQFC